MLNPSFAKIRVLVVDLASAGMRHVENLLSLGVRDVTACSEWRKLKQLAVGGREVEVVNDYLQALDRNPDAVFIANPTSFQVAYLEKAVERGCHVYVEKPLAAASSAGHAAILRRILERKSVVAVGHQLRFNECLRRLKSQLSNGVIGRILHVHVDMGEFLPDYHPDEDYRVGYAARAELGGGVLSTQIHDINYLHWLLGPFQRVYAVGGKISELEIDVEDSVSFLMKANGCPVTVHMDYLQRCRERLVIVTGELGTLNWNYYLNTLTLSNGLGQTETGPGGSLVRNEMFLAAVSDFLTCIQTQASPTTDFREAVMDLTVVDAIRDSFSSDKAVTVCYDVA